MRVRFALPVIVLAGALLTCLPVRAEGASSTAETVTISAPAANQDAARLGESAVAGPGGKQRRLSGLGDKAFPLAVVLVVFAWLSFSSWCDYRKRSVLLTLHHQERMAALEKGLELPPYPNEGSGSHADVLAALQPDKPGRPLLIGLVWLFLGIGLAVVLWGIKAPHASPAIGALPAGIGLAYLIYHFVEARKTS